MILRKLVLMAWVIAVLAVPLNASPCGTVYYPQTYGFSTYKAPVHDYEIKKRVVVLEYQLIPSFPIGVTSGYTQQSTAPQAVQTPCDSKIAELSAKIAELSAKVAGSPLPGTTPPGTLPATSPKTPTPTLTAKCANCHGKEASSKGRNITLFDDSGELLKLDDKMYGSVVRAISSGKMPKDGTMTPEEFTKVIQELVNLHNK